MLKSARSIWFSFQLFKFFAWLCFLIKLFAMYFLFVNSFSHLS
eukprot:UN09175